MILHKPFKEQNMTSSFVAPSFLPQDEEFTVQMTELQHAIHENRLKLEKVKRQRLRVEEETIKCTRETERRMELVLVNSRTVDMLQQLGQMLQEEKRLSEQLTGQTSEDRDLKSEQERLECFKGRKRSLAAEIVDAKAKARNMAVKATTHTQIRRPKRNQSKVK